MKMKGKPFVQIGHGSKPMNEFFNVNLFLMLYLTLFPYGCGGFEDSECHKLISLKEHVKHLFSLREKRFQTHYLFLFTDDTLKKSYTNLKKLNFFTFRLECKSNARHCKMLNTEVVGAILTQVESGECVTA